MLLTIYLIESKAPEGYLLNEEKMFFEIKENGEVVKADMTNEKIFDVPNTSIKEISIINIISILLFALGIGLVMYGRKKA